ncbi:MAG TPA: hypothetical protein DCZ03_07550 [Gammaproteobacteria bacterium]|nr:hypothetical protein [Gammaproteobacteria bacterium]
MSPKPISSELFDEVIEQMADAIQAAIVPVILVAPLLIFVRALINPLQYHSSQQLPEYHFFNLVCLLFHGVGGLIL